MEKTKLGLSTSMLAAIAFLACFFGGYTPMLIVVGYILIAEKDEWLRKNAATAMVVTFGFSLLTSVIYLIPNIISLIDTGLGIFNANFSIYFVTWAVNFVTSALDLVEKVFFLVMAVLALGHKTFDIPVLSDFIVKHLNNNEEKTAE